ncbi:MAG: hypothetical protein K2Q10_09390, partial [Rhodospirillales bacterium]|nr:hypothetical protein [Rhodospirillales bacterium]
MTHTPVPRPRRGPAFGVSFRLLAGMTVLVALTLAAGTVAILSAHHFRSGFARIAGEWLPAIVSAGRLGQQSESIVAQAPQLMAARSALTRESVKLRITDQVAWLKELVARLDPGIVPPEQIAHLHRLQDELAANLDTLDELMVSRLAAEEARLRYITRATTLAAALRGQDEQVVAAGLERMATLAAAPDAPVAQLRRETEEMLAARRWVVLAGEAVALALGGVATEERTALMRMQMGFEGALERAEAVRAHLPETTAHIFAPLAGQLRILGQGPDGVFAARLAAMEVENALRGSSGRNSLISDRLVSAVSTTYSGIEIRVRQEIAEMDRTIGGQTLALSAVAALCVLGAGGMVLYIRRSVIQRLQALQVCMTARADGEAMPVPSAGADDEIAAMARALEVFVETIAAREEALKA